MFLVFKRSNPNANVYVKAIHYLYSRFEISIGYAKTIFLNYVVYSCYRMKFICILRIETFARLQFFATKMF